MSLRVLVVDDTILYRRLIGEVLEEIEGVELVGSAGGGRMALTRIESLRPDLVTLDIEMPDLDGIAVLQEMQRRGLDAGVVVLSAVTVRGGEMTIKALQLGAFDFVTKPSGGTPEQNRLALRQALEPVVKAFTRRKEVRGILRGPGTSGSTPAADAPGPAPGRPSATGSTTGSTAPGKPEKGAAQPLRPVGPPTGLRPTGPMSGPARSGVGTPASGTPSPTLRGVSRPAGLAPPPVPTVAPGLDDITRRMGRLARGARPELVLIGVSTGGPNALAKMLPQLPGSIGVPVLVVQHMPPLFTKSLADSLAPRCALRVKEAEPGETARAGTVYIAPGGRQMKVVAGEGGDPRLEINDDPPENNCRPAVDYLFRSASLVYPGRTVAVVMTGMGSDGTAGMRLLKQAGALTIAQDEATCVVYGMPKEAVSAGVVDLVLPLDEIAEGIARAVRGAAA